MILLQNYLIISQNKVIFFKIYTKNKNYINGLNERIPLGIGSKTNSTPFLRI